LSQKVRMRLPILSYGHGILRQKCEFIQNDYPDLTKLIANMWETLYGANGCGLAAPQVGKQIRLFIVDSRSTFNNLEPSEQKIYFEAGDTGIIETFVNAQIINRSERCWEDEEGCLSIPDLSQPVKRPWSITIQYYTPDFEKQTKTFSGSTARMVQHEYEHTEGTLYLDHLNPLTRRLMESKLKRIIKGQVKPKYPMKFLK
jgi:peptide deformylase